MPDPGSGPVWTEGNTGGIMTVSLIVFVVLFFLFVLFSAALRAPGYIWSLL